MKLKNIIKIGSFIVAGTLPTTSQAQVYECKQCPAGTYSGGGTATSCTPCPAGKYSNPGATSCSTCSAGTYSTERSSSCTPCASGQYSAAGASSCSTCSGWKYIENGNCIDVKYQISETIADLTTGGQEKSGTLKPGFYAVILGGGDGGGDRIGEKIKLDTNNISQFPSGRGAKLQYAFKIDSPTNYHIASGAKGVAGDVNKFGCSHGGGGGSWLQVGNTYYVSGGGGGGLGIMANFETRISGQSPYLNTSLCAPGMSSQGGLGGSIGGGGGSGDWHGKCAGAPGGASGSYAGGTGGVNNTDGGNGSGISGGKGGSLNKLNSNDDNHRSPENSYGGIGAYCTTTSRSGLTSYTNEYKYIDSSRCGRGSTSDCVEYKSENQTIYYQMAGDGKTSHSSNTSKFNDKLCLNCARLYKLK